MGDKQMGESELKEFELAQMIWATSSHEGWEEREQNLKRN